MAIKTPTRKAKAVPCFADLTIPVEVLNGDIGLSQSLLTTAMQCDRQLVYSLNRWEKPGKEQNTFFGTCAHQLMDTFYTLGSKPDEQQLEEALTEFLEKEQEAGRLEWLNPVERAYQECILIVIMSEYFSFYEDDFLMDFIEVEKKFRVRYNGLTLVGKKDGKVRMKDKRILLLEHKTKGDINEDAIARNLDLNFQNQFYLLADRIDSKPRLAASGVLYNIIRRTKSRPKGKETLREYGERLRREIHGDFDYFFKRFDASYTPKQNAEFEEELKLKTDHVLKMLQGKRKALKNEAFCFYSYECDYAQACSQNSLEGYRQRHVVSPELV
jgi:hypothetical protein